MHSIGKIIAESRKKKGLSQPELADLLSEQGIHVTAKAISKWETDAREPGLHTFFTLCRLLEIEDIYDAYFGVNPYSVMNGLNQAGKDRIKDYADILRASGLFKPDSNIIPFRPTAVFKDIYEDAVSAGTGNFLTDTPKNSYEVSGIAPDHASFGVRISGDSMEPEYLNGEIAWIQQKDSLSSGEVGIFYLNGEAYIKKLYDEPDGLRLLSLNKKYAPIIVQENDSFKVFGKVIGKCSSSDIHKRKQ
ncbi:MAG: XRE family transcriptional regulator [Clostridiales bacterium]|nr:XRE family transcriptional regulator [Clostridiales bacterium]